MADTNLSKITTTDLTNTETLFSVASKQPDSAGEQNETTWCNPKFSAYFGYYKTIPELKKAIDALATWTAGKGYKCSPATKVILDHIKGWGEDSFQSILMNLLVMKKINGDSFAEIIRDDKKNTLINLKPLNPGTINIVTNKQGKIIRYEQIDKRTPKSAPVKFQPEEILHLSNDRVADEIHGVSVVEACEWVILARNEAMTDWRKVLHRNVVPLRIIEVDTDNSTKITLLKTQYQEAINKGEVLVIPKGNVEVKETAPILQDPQSWIRYLENFFYQAVGVPKIILGGSEEFTEASSKIGYLTFEQVYMTEQMLLEADLWNQLAIKIEFERPVSLKEELMGSEEKNTGQVGFQPKETQAGLTRE